MTKVINKTNREVVIRQKYLDNEGKTRIGFDTLKCLSTNEEDFNKQCELGEHLIMTLKRIPLPDKKEEKK